MTRTLKFIQTKHINSFQALLVLVFFYRHAASSFTNAQIAEQLYLGDGPLLEEITTSLQAAGLIDRIGNRYKFHNTPEFEADIQHLVNLYQQPVARQKIIDQVRQQPHSMEHG